MNKIITETTEYLEFRTFKNRKRIKHFISTRKGGISSSPYDGMNISFETKDTSANVAMNRIILSEAVEIPLDNFVMQNQVHGNEVVVITSKDKGKGVFSHKDVVGNCDGMITNEIGICLFLFGADCVPILFYDPIKQVIGAAHSGWQGTVKKIAKSVVTKMTETYNSNPKDIIVGIGPSISMKNYEVGNNVTEAVLAAFGTTNGFMQLNEKTGKMHFDMWTTCKKTLIKAGVLENNIEISELCTFENKELFFSARRDEPSGRFGAGIMLFE